MSANERATRAVREILQSPGNDVCADCGAPDPGWGSCSLGVFICLACSGIHRNIPDISKVKSLSLSRWEDHEVQFMAENGNELMKSKYEATVPVYYYKPTHKDCQVLREQWIRAKYERKEFCEPGKSFTYEEGSRDGMLMKRGRDNGQFLSRRFVLSEREGTLKYFTKYDAKEPKAVIKVDTINATLQPEKIGNPNGMQITYLKDYSTRNIFVYHESGKEIVDWLNSIRAVQLHYLKVAFPGATDAELVPKLSRNFLKEGYMEKTGPRAICLTTSRLTVDLFAFAANGGLQEALVHSGPPATDVLQRSSGRLRQRGGVLGEQGPRLQRLPRPARWHPLQRRLAARHHHKNARALLPVHLRDGERPARLAETLRRGVMSAQMSPQEYTMEALFKHRH
ncbi:hypothetical protein L3Q82_019998 [Scortum barcoo]|uniref:Uncharacterized protein n=1 Tax=Scortum barcoo TaxID=214431 RepID=A0ACB8VCQ2_9TELE|nr:hypothetical protein L3Q82_019998 [Scortum barcoo]